MATVNVQELIDGRKLGGFQVMVVALCALIVLIDGFDTRAPAGEQAVQAGACAP